MFSVLLLIGDTSFETLRSLMSWDSKKQQNSSSFNSTDGKSRTYVKSHNTNRVKI